MRMFDSVPDRPPWHRLDELTGDDSAPVLPASWIPHPFADANQGEGAAPETDTSPTPGAELTGECTLLVEAEHWPAVVTWLLRQPPWGESPARVHLGPGARGELAGYLTRYALAVRREPESDADGYPAYRVLVPSRSVVLDPAACDALAKPWLDRYFRGWAAVVTGPVPPALHHLPVYRLSVPAGLVLVLVTEVDPWLALHVAAQTVPVTIIEIDRDDLYGATGNPPEAPTEDRLLLVPPGSWGVVWHWMSRHPDWWPKSPERVPTSQGGPAPIGVLISPPAWPAMVMFLATLGFWPALHDPVAGRETFLVTLSERLDPPFPPPAAPADQPEPEA